MPSLNIKNPDVAALAQRLASLTGESITEAVRSSLELRLAQVNPEAEERLERLRGSVRRITEALPAGMTSSDINDLLYDEHGMPK
jgi:hypothetical protein